MNLPDALQQTLHQLLGADGLLTDAASCQLYAQDVFTEALPALAVLRPNTVAQLQAAVKHCVDAGLALVPRGGGMSYTKGYVPAHDRCVIVDCGRLNQVVEINREDMFVTVEAGCTWQALHQALSAEGLRTPYWGTLSGLKASVGGSLSQNSIFWGSGHHGFAADSVIGLEVVTANGDLLHTGAGAQQHSSPFIRHYGPDLTGIFCCDAGALGIKARVTLRLLPVLPARAYLSVAFENFASQQACMSALARENLAAECFGFDPFLQRQRMQRESLAADVKALTGVVKQSGSLWTAAKDAIGLGLAGRRFMRDVQWSFHAMFEDRNAAAVNARVQDAERLVRLHGGRVLDNSIPKVLRANPFGPLNNMLGPQGERWVPVHALVPHSKAVQAYEATEAVFAEFAEAIQQHKIGVGYLVATVAQQCFVLEPVFFWPDAIKPLHRHAVEPQHLKKLTGFAENLPARECVTRIRQVLIERYCQLGAVHLQIGKSYPYREGLRSESFALVQALKTQLDPHNMINPGALGL